jgi:hypothetical protein
MRQLLHLLIVDRERHRAIVQWLDGRWLLPTIACSERARAPLVAASWLRERGVNGFVSGQWSGRIAPAGSSIDWLIAISVEAGRLPSPCSWCPVDRLSSHQALVEYQGSAIAEAFARGRPGVQGPFGELSWIDAASVWVARATSARCRPSACFRASPHEVVVAYTCSGTTLYFKGLAEDRAFSAVAECEAARSAPGSFSRTLAQERRHDGAIWTLTSSCAGEPVRRPLDDSIAVRIASDVGRLQRRLHCDIALRSVLTPLDLDHACTVMGSLLSRHGFSPSRARVDAAFEAVGNIEPGWAPTDLDPANVRVSPDSLQYFDLDARLAAPPLAIAIFAGRVEQGSTDRCIQLRRRIRAAFEASWKRSVPWAAIDIVSAIAELTIGWERVQRNVYCGELTGDVEAVEQRLAQRLIQLIR